MGIVTRGPGRSRGIAGVRAGDGTWWPRPMFPPGNDITEAYALTVGRY